MFPAITAGAAAAAVCLAFLVKPGAVEQVASLGTARSVHTATTLPSGQVLIAGGMAEGGSGVQSAELFDPARNTVLQLPQLTEARLGHTATVLRDGRVVLAGGYNGGYLASLEIFDPTARVFRAAGSLREGRSGHTATLLHDGRILFTGGVGSGWTFLASAEIYDLQTGRSERVSPMSVPRESHTATLLADGRVLVIGGHTGRRQNMEVYASAEVFHPGTGRFEAAGTMVTPRHKHDAIALSDGRVLVIGGADRTDRNHFASTEIYDPANGRFEPGPDMTDRRYKIALTSVLLPNGDVLVTSGGRSAELLDHRTAQFRQVPGRVPDAFRFAAAAALRDGDVLISGGYSDANRNTAGVWRYRSR